MTHGELQRGSEPAGGVPSLPGPATEWGWYLYGVVHGDTLEQVEWGTLRGLDGQQNGLLLARGELAVVVSPVRLAEFGAQALRSRLRDSEWLEAMVRGHERVVESVFHERAILPARFGCVYATAEDVLAALERHQDELREQLGRLADREEWSVHLYASSATVARLAAADQRASALKHELAEARPGRAYFLRRKLADLAAEATEQSLADLANQTHRRLASIAVDDRVSSVGRALSVPESDLPVLRAAYLVARDSADDFLAEVRRLVDGQEGLRCEFSGPWPPYSFAALGPGGPG